MVGAAGVEPKASASTPAIRTAIFSSSSSTGCPFEKRGPGERSIIKERA